MVRNGKYVDSSIICHQIVTVFNGVVIDKEYNIIIIVLFFKFFPSAIL